LLLSVAPTFLGLTCVTFRIGRIIPIDPVLAIVGDKASRATYDRVAAEIGVNLPIPVQYWRYLKKAPHTECAQLIRTPSGSDIPSVRRAGARRDSVGKQGGVAQGIGWALNEEYVYDQDGRLENPGFLDSRVPVCSDSPMTEAILIEVPNPRHPFGARGVGEVPIVPPMAAVANAIADATGLPMSPPKLRAALDECDPPRIAAE